MTKEYLNSGKLVASICAASRLLIEWELVNGRKITGNNWDNNFDNLAKTAGAISINEDVVVDRNLVTAKGPESVEAFFCVREVHCSKIPSRCIRVKIDC